MNARENLGQILESPEFAPFPECLDDRIVKSLNGRGIDRLYIHQTEVYKQCAGQGV